MFGTVTLLTAAAAGSIASVTGFGIGSLLTPLASSWFSMPLAVAVVSIPHAVGTALRLWQLRTPPDTRVLRSFGITSAAGGLLGALLQSVAGSRPLMLLLGMLLLFTAVSELAGWNRRMRFSGWRAWAAGALSGTLGGLVGNQGGIRAAALLGFDLPRDTFVATATAIALMVDAARMPLYVWTQGDMLRAHLLWIAIATGGVVAGTFTGGRILARVPEPYFRVIVGLVIGALGVSMIERWARG
jgi:uncharacterized membrane protein YfcA